MRRVHWMLLLATALVLTVSLGNMYLLNHGVAKLEQILEPMESAIFQQEWDTVADLYQKADQVWRQDRNIWQLTIDHVETENIEVAFAQLQAGIALKETTIAIEGLYLLAHNIEHILYIEKLSWQNIL